MLGHAACVAMSTPRINTSATKSTTLTEVREENIMRQNAKFLALFLLMAMGAASQRAQAVNLTVNCDRHESLHKALRLLATSNPQGPNTITVSGACKGNIVIKSMDRLTLITRKGASITDRSNGTLAVVDIEDSRSVTVQGFTINGGAQGILCNTASVCYLTGNTIQGRGGFGVDVRGSRAFLESNVIQNWNRGAFIAGSAEAFSSNDVIQGNEGSAIAVLNRSYFESLNSTLDNNGVGIEAGGSGVFLGGGTISGNTFDGVRVLAASEAIFSGPTITANGGVGVLVLDGSFAGFLAASITGNLSGLDVDCEPQFPITRFVDRTGGITNCVEPTNKSQLQDLK
jgi:Right handed beta helix region